MRAMVIDRQGPSSVFHEAERPCPQTRPGHVLIRVRASSVNPVDYKIRSGMPIAPDFPAVLHGDVAGEVVEVGEGVSDFAVGDAVYGCAGGVSGTQGALAEYMLADARLLAPKPSNLSMEQAAALPLVGITAWEGLERTRVIAGANVLVHGGTGGVGHMALQLARTLGATITTTVSTREKTELAESLGAHNVVLYPETSVEDYVSSLSVNGEGFDFVFDTVGGENLERSFAAVRRGGWVSSISTRRQYDLSIMHAKGLTLHVVFMLIPLLYDEDREKHGRILRSLTQLVEQGQVRPLLDGTVFDFTEVGQAHDYLQAGKAKGKVVLRGFS